ncbi:MAG: diacylglycerol kinase family protein [Thermoanaerobaculia bacterium]
MSTASLIFNPRAGRWRTPQLVDRILRALERPGQSIEAWPTRSPGDATRLARQVVEAGAETVYAFGGDGTLREAAAGLLGSNAILGTIPGGTTNVIPLALGLPPRPVAAARRLREATPIEMDVGRCGTEIFLMQASGGLDARALHHLDPVHKRYLGKIAVALAGLSQWRKYDYPDLELVADGRTQFASFFAICNLPYYGGRFRLAPAARLDDHQLHLVLFHGRGRAVTLAFARDLALGKHEARGDVEVLRVQEVELKAPPGLALQLDGDAMSSALPMTVRLAEERLRVLALPGAAG